MYLCFPPAWIYPSLDCSDAPDSWSHSLVTQPSPEILDIPCKIFLSHEYQTVQTNTNIWLEKQKPDSWKKTQNNPNPKQNPQTKEPESTVHNMKNYTYRSESIVSLNGVWNMYQNNYWELLILIHTTRFLYCLYQGQLLYQVRIQTDFGNLSVGVY